MVRLILLGVCFTGFARWAPAAETPVDFTADVQPIFARHCLECHGQERHAGGLRLDSRSAAMSGGDSGLPILTAGPDNELLARVATEERAFRMPKNAEPLSAAEIETLRRWIAQGADWPETPVFSVRKVEADDLPWWNAWVIRITDFTDPHAREIAAVRPVMFVLLLLLPCVLIGGRLRQRRQKFANFAPSRWQRGLMRCDNRVYAAAMLLAGVAAAILILREQKLVLAETLAASQSELDGTRKQLAVYTRSDGGAALFGDPPIPPHLGQPRSLASEYYRGNCERNAELFNNGNYRTATFNIALCNRAGESLNYGDPLPTDGVAVRFELSRAPLATDKLFSEEILQAVFLTETPLGREESAPVSAPKPVIPLTTLEPGERWSALVPLRVDRQATNFQQFVIYVAKGKTETIDGQLTATSGEAHYGIGLDLTIADGRIAAASELWMGPLMVPGNVVVPMENQLPLCEWFDWRPLPVIEGGNSTDPGLLGVEEHLPAEN